MGMSWNDGAEGNFKSNLHFLFAFYGKIRCRFLVSDLLFFFLLFIFCVIFLFSSVGAASCECDKFSLVVVSVTPHSVRRSMRSR